jgi:phosphoserine phosphatase RsbU/P
MITGPTLAAPDPKLEQLRNLASINRAFTYTTSLDEVARLTVESGAKLLDATAAVLMLPNADDLLDVRAAHGVADERIARFRVPLDDEVIGRLQGLLEVPDDWFVAVPLVVGGVVTGLLAVALRRASTAPDEWLLAALADQAAVALENARLGGEVRLEMETRLNASERAMTSKDRALVTLAHDIRSPLASIEGYCAILEEGLYGPIGEKQREGLGRIRRSGRHLLSLLDNVMDMARLSAGAIVVRSESVHLLEVAQEAVDMLTPASFAKHQRLRLAASDDVVVIGDAARTRQVLVNLVGNAVKFTPPEGSITVSVNEHATGWGEIRVTDTGPGVSEFDRTAIFEPYYRSEGTAMIPGVGLGLAISHGLMTQMGGRLDVESELGAGSSFMIRLPLLAELSESRHSRR